MFEKHEYDDWLLIYCTQADVWWPVVSEIITDNKANTDNKWWEEHLLTEQLVTI